MLHCKAEQIAAARAGLNVPRAQSHKNRRLAEARVEEKPDLKEANHATALSREVNTANVC